MSEQLSAKMRAYLAEVYRLADMSDDADHYVSTSALADVLDVSAPAVNRMINRLKELGMLEHEPYQGIRLTPAGEQQALVQLRAARIAESFLGSVMKLSWEEVYTEAQNMSTALSPKLIERMYEMAGSPTHSPHGEPIPDAQGVIHETEDILLSEAQAEMHVTVTRLRTYESDRLAYLEALGLVPGALIEVMHKAPFDGPMQLKLNDEYRIIGHNLAELIRVNAISDETESA
jgi:DtxR family Mn-dependent transcriptional regulator